MQYHRDTSWLTGTSSWQTRSSMFARSAWSTPNPISEVWPQASEFISSQPASLPQVNTSEPWGHKPLLNLNYQIWLQEMNIFCNGHMLHTPCRYLEMFISVNLNNPLILSLVSAEELFWELPNPSGFTHFLMVCALEKHISESQVKSLSLTSQNIWLEQEQLTNCPKLCSLWSGPQPIQR